jgi:hypothetical protein
MSFAAGVAHRCCRGAAEARGRLARGLPVLLLALGSAAALAAIDAELAADQVAAGQPVTLTLTSDAPLPPRIDLTPLEADFRVLEQRRAEIQTTVDGRRRQRHELILTLLPQRTGELRVPSLALGDAASPALPLTVAATTTPNARLLPAPTTAAPAPAPAGPMDISVTADITPTAGVVGQQFLLSVRARSADGPPQGRLPPPAAADARVLPLGEQRMVDAVGRHVFEQRFALFPQAPGRLVIDGLGFDAWAVGGGAPVRERAAALAIEVKPRPAQWRTGTWLPARDVSLTEAGPTEVRIAPGQGMERLVTLRAEGLMAEDLPPIPLDIPFPLRVRDDPPRLWNERTPDGVVGYRAERMLVSTEDPGTYVLPGPAIDWWDTETGTARTATLPDWTLTVAPFASAERRPAARWESDRIYPVPADDAPAAPASSPADADVAADGRDGAFPWIPLLGGAAGLLLLTLLGWLVLRRRRAPAAVPAPAGTPTHDPPAAGPSQATAAALEALRRAYAGADAAAARAALLAWAALAWPEQPPRNLSQLMLRLDAPLADEIKLLDKAFYGPADAAWAACPVPQRVAELAAGDDAAGPA